MENEKYNPAIHCCPYWYKDFCDCVKEDFKQYRKDQRDRSVTSMYGFLERHKVQYKHTATENIVLVNYESPTPIYLSLKTKHQKLKFRYSGSSRWIYALKSEFVKILKNGKN